MLARHIFLKRILDSSDVTNCLYDLNFFFKRLLDSSDVANFPYDLDFSIYQGTFYHIDLFDDIAENTFIRHYGVQGGVVPPC